MRKWIVSVFILLAFTACDGRGRPVVRVGVDPGFFPMEVQGRESAVLGFCNELLAAISDAEKVNFERVNVAWDTLLEGLGDGKYDGVLSSMQPYVFNLKKYVFSHLFLQSGPVLIVRDGSRIKGFKDLRGKEIAVTNMSAENLIVEMAAGVIPRDVASNAKALLDVKMGVLDGAFLERIPAEGFVNDLYAGVLEIVSEPVGESGLRFVMLRNDDDRWVAVFDRGLKHVMSSGQYQKILDKWKL